MLVAAALCALTWSPTGAKPQAHEAARAHAGPQPMTKSPATTHPLAELGFAHRLERPERANGDVLVLLHGSGGDQETLIPMAREAAPGATLLGVRGRVMQDGVTRWYRRVTAVRFDQRDIRSEAQAFADFLGQAVETYGLEEARLGFVGYSNGANLVAALALLKPRLVRQAALLRAMPVLDKPPVGDLSRSRFLVVAGRDDQLYARYSPALEQALSKRGALVEAHLIAAGHMLTEEDTRLVGAWLAGGPAVSMATE